MECTRNKRKGEVEYNKSSHIKEGRKSFYNGGEEGEDERKLGLTLMEFGLRRE